MRPRHHPIASLLVLWAIVAPSAPALAEDWPEWRGAGRTGVWTEDGILERFPARGLKLRWRSPIHAGYAGPAVSDGRVFVTDFKRAGGAKHGNVGFERAVCLDESTGKQLWVATWPARYDGIEPAWATGPRATPTVDGERVYVLGTMGKLVALNAETGREIWRRDFVEDYATEVPGWGMVGAPIVDGKLLIALVGGSPDAKVVAFDKLTGKEVWRALSSTGEPGYAPPLLVQAGGVRQLIVWHPEAVSSLNPQTGAVYWEQPFDVRLGLTVATPVFDGHRGNRLLVSSFFNGSLMLELSSDQPGARVLWQGKSKSEIQTDGLHALMTTPVLDGDQVYGVCSYGQFRALNARTGARLWQSNQPVGEKARWAAALVVRHDPGAKSPGGRDGNRYFINNDRGDLILATLGDEGFHEIDRTRLIAPTTKGGGRRELGLVHWSHPAYANRHIVVRNDDEIISYSLAAP